MRDLQIPWDGIWHGKQRGSFLMLTSELGSLWHQSTFLDVGKKSCDYFLDTEKENEKWSRVWKEGDLSFTLEYDKTAVI